jgi:hypothetical protein
VSFRVQPRWGCTLCKRIESTRRECGVYPGCMKQYVEASTLAPWRERALAAEARVRNLEETVGELVSLIPSAPTDGREAAEELLDDVCDMGWA